MKTYGELDLKKIMDAENLDFARWTYGKGQCSCCYGPLDMPEKFWRNGKKPRRHFLSEDKQIWDYRLNGEKFDKDSMRYILFKNAYNCSGTVKENDIIKDYTCVGYVLNDMEQVQRISEMIQEQLDDDYVVQVPVNMYHCIVIRTKAVLKKREEAQ